MEIKELEKRIKKLLKTVNEDLPKAIERDNFVYLSSLVLIYSKILGDEIIIDVDKHEKIVKKTHYQSTLEEIGNAKGILLDISETILQAKKEAPFEFPSNFRIKTYSRKYLEEIFESFLVSLGDKFYYLYNDAKKDGRIFYNEVFSKGTTVFDYQKQKSTIFVPSNRETITFLITFAHEIGHTYENDYTKATMRPSSSTKFKIAEESFPMFLEIALIDYLKQINFDPKELELIEMHWFWYLNQKAAEVMFGFSLPRTIVNYKKELVIPKTDMLEAQDLCDAIFDSYDVRYIYNGIVFEESVGYMCGGLLALIYAHYYQQDKAFLREIQNHFFDYEVLNGREELERNDLLQEELRTAFVLKKRLGQIKTNQI